MASDTTGSNCPRLAQELIENIIDHLYEDTETLWSCALASKSTLAASERHRFSALKISGDNMHKLRKLYDLYPMSTGDRNSRDPDETGVDKLLDQYVTELTFTSPWNWNFSPTRDNFPIFPKLQRIVFKGKKFTDFKLPLQGWDSHFKGVQSVELNFEYMDDGWCIINTLYNLPKTVEVISFTATQYDISPYNLSSRIIKTNENPPITHHLNGTLNLNLSCYKSHAELLSVILRLEEQRIFKFNLKQISYHLTYRADIFSLASLVNQCKDLQFLDIKCSPLCELQML